MAKNRYIKAFLVLLTIISFILKGTPLLIFVAFSLIIVFIIDKYSLKKLVQSQMIITLAFLLIQPFLVNNCDEKFIGIGYSSEFLYIGLNTFMRALILIPAFGIIFKFDAQIIDNKILKKFGVTFFLSEAINSKNIIERKVRAKSFKTIIKSPVESISDILSSLLK